MITVYDLTVRADVLHIRRVTLDDRGRLQTFVLIGQVKCTQPDRAAQLIQQDAEYQLAQQILLEQEN